MFLRKEVELSTAEKAVESYMMQYPQEALKMSVRELAEASFTSPASVMRMCKKMGYDSFNDFKIDLAQIVQQDGILKDIDVDFPVLMNYASEQIFSILSTIERRAIKETETMLASMKDWYKIVQLVEKARSIGVYGIGYSYDASMKFVRNMKRMGYYVNHEEEYSSMSSWASSVDCREVSIIVSYSGENYLLNSVAEVLRKRGMKVIAITSSSKNTLTSLSDYVVTVPLTEKKYMNNRISSFCSTLEFEYVLDCLYASIFTRNFSMNQNHLNNALKVQGATDAKAIEKIMKSQK